MVYFWYNFLDLLWENVFLNKVNYLFSSKRGITNVSKRRLQPWSQVRGLEVANLFWDSIFWSRVESNEHSKKMFEVENSEKIVRESFLKISYGQLWPRTTSDDLKRHIKAATVMKLFILFPKKYTRNALERSIPNSTTLQLSTLYLKKQT